MKRPGPTLVLTLALAFNGVACDDHGHGHGDHGHGDHGHDDDHGHGDHGHDEQGHDDHGGGHGDHGGGHDDGHGHGDHDGASEVVTLWGKRTQLFVEFPALVAGEDSPFAAHLTRLQDHFALTRGTVVVELSGGGKEVERFSVDHPSVAGIFRPVVKPRHQGLRRVTLRLDSPEASEVHDMGEFTVFPSREAADAAAPAEEESAEEISYLLEQQWKVPFKVEQTEARPMRPNFPTFARLTLPSEAESTLTAPRDGRVGAVGGRFPLVGEEVEAGMKLFELTSAPQEGADAATLDLAVEQAAIKTMAAQREVERVEPLVAQGVVAQRRLDEARSLLAQTQAELRSARRRRASLGQSQRIGGAGDGLAIPSPLHGTLAELFVAPGAWVSAGDKLARVIDGDLLWLDVAVPEAYVGRLREVSGAWFKLEHVPGVFEVPREALVSIGSEVDPQSRTLPVRFRLNNLRRELFAGMSVQAHLIADEPRLTVAVPLAAIIDDAGTDVVYVQTGGESFERRPVKLGVRDGDMVEVLEGVAVGQWVVTRGAYAVKLASSSTESVGHGHAH